MNIRNGKAKTAVITMIGIVLLIAGNGVSRVRL